MPMQGRYDVVGLIYIDTSIPAGRALERGANKFTEEHLKLMVAIGHQAALAVEDTNYYSAMVQAERLAAVGQTIATLSHHIKNILQGIRGGSYLIEMGLAEHDEQVVRKGWDIVERNQSKISALVMDMLTFSKEREPDFAPADLNTVVGDVVELMQRRAGELKVDLHWEPDPTIPSSRSITRAFIGPCSTWSPTRSMLATNETASAMAAWCESRPAHLSGEGLVQVVVEDNGTGIPSDDLPQIFNAFFCAKVRAARDWAWR